MLVDEKSKNLRSNVIRRAIEYEMRSYQDLKIHFREKDTEENF